MEKEVLVILLIISSIYAINISETIKSTLKGITINPDAGLDIYKFLRKYNYPVETHWILTEDGYVLRMQRIPNGRNTTKESSLLSKKKPAVLLMHGLFCSAMDFVNTGPGKALALILADEGYDVWLGNNRGTTWSRNHIRLNPDVDQSFWDYSFETCGYYDLPAKIDYILEKTGHQQLLYVGHSQGTTQFFAMAAMRPEYNKKIALMAALAPVAYVSNNKSPIFRFIETNMEALEPILKSLKLTELLPHSNILNPILALLASDGSPLQDLIADVQFVICGEDSPQLNKTILPVILSNTPAGISLMMMVHFAQEFKSGYFRRYDYKNKNIEVYGTFVPPEFDLSTVTVPIALYSGKNDWLAVPEDVDKLAKNLPNIVKNRIIDYELFNHFDFLTAKDVKTLLYDELLEDLEKYSDNEDIMSTIPPHSGRGHKTIFSLSVILSALSIIVM